jgi:hypothetical protein
MSTNSVAPCLITLPGPVLDLMAPVRETFQAQVPSSRLLLKATDWPKLRHFAVANEDFFAKPHYIYRLGSISEGLPADAVAFIHGPDGSDGQVAAFNCLASDAACYLVGSIIQGIAPERRADFWVGFVFHQLWTQPHVPLVQPPQPEKTDGRAFFEVEIDPFLASVNAIDLANPGPSPTGRSTGGPGDVEWSTWQPLTTWAREYGVEDPRTIRSRIIDGTIKGERWGEKGRKWRIRLADLPEHARERYRLKPPER